MKRIFFLFLLIFQVQLLFAGSSIDLNSIKESVLVYGNEVQFIEDTTKSLTLNDVLTRADYQREKEVSTVKNIDANYWIKLDIVPDESRKWVIEVITPQTENISFYGYANGSFTEYSTGHLHPINSRTYRHKNFVFNLNSVHKPYSVFFKIKSKNKVGFLFKIQTQEHFSAYSLGEYWFLGFYYGILLLLIVYHLVFFIYLRKPVYLFYCLTVLFAGLISASDDGLGIMYVWKSWPEYSQSIGLYLLPLLYIVAFSLYSATFLGKKFRVYQRFILWTLLGYGLLFGLQVISSSQKIYFSQFYATPFIIYYLIFLFIAIKYKYKPAVFFTIGFSFSLFGIIINQLRLLNILEGSVITVYAFNVGVVLEFFSLAMSLAYKVRDDARQKKIAQERKLQLLKEKNEAQENLVKVTKEKERITREINKELEIKVQDRTSQLSDLIDKLKSLNLEYDKENWELKRTVQSEKHSKLVQENLSLKELLQLYPTNYKCWEYLAELKWSAEKNYKCFRCGHENYSINKKNFSRKCSRCSTTHAVTKDSIFHAQKLPLNKLFYLTYLWNSSENLNVKAVADELSISETSLYKFLAKIKAKKEFKKKQKHPIKSWVDIII